MDQLERPQFQPDPGGSLVAVHLQGRGPQNDERDQSSIPQHDHDGSNSRPIPLQNIIGFIQTVSAAPTWTPRNFFEQMAIYKSGGTKRLYVYDFVNHIWSYTALT
jgi:hypothetical protein